MKNHLKLKWTMITIGLFVIMFSSCSNPKKEAFDFITSNNKIAGVNLFDGGKVVGDISEEWRKEYNVTTSIQQNGESKTATVEVTLSKHTKVTINYSLKNAVVLGVDIHPFFKDDNEQKELKAFYDLVREYSKTKFKPIGNGNTFENLTDKSCFLSINGESNPSVSNLSYYYDYASLLMESNSKFYENSKKIIAKKIILDSRDGIVTVPNDKIWVIKTKRLVSEKLLDSTKQKSEKQCDCAEITIDNYSHLPDIAINGECLILKGSLNAGKGGSFTYFGGFDASYADENVYKIVDINQGQFNYKIVPQTSTICVPVPRGYAFELLDIDEYSLSQVPELQNSLQLLNKMGYKNDNNKLILLLNGKL